MCLTQEEDTVRLARPLENLVENGRVRVLRFRFRPGDKALMHSHPDNILCVVKGGRTQLDNPFAEREIMDLETGKAFFFEAQPHEVANVGETDIELLIVELK